VLFRNGLDGRVVEQQRRIVGLLHVEFQERLRAEGRVCSNGESLALGEA